MDNYLQHYWQLRLDGVQKALEKNNFEVYRAADPAAARTLVLESIVPATGAKTVSWGGSRTFVETGLHEALVSGSDPRPLDTYDKSLSKEQMMERRREALLVDLFFTGTNAVTETGVLVNLDMIGNRVGALTFGPRHVVVLAGRNKIVADTASAIARIKGYTAPANAMRLDMKTPCVETGKCEECRSPSRICNNWTITEKSFPKGRVKVVLIETDTGI